MIRPSGFGQEPVGTRFSHHKSVTAVNRGPGARLVLSALSPRPLALDDPGARSESEFSSARAPVTCGSAAGKAIRPGWRRKVGFRLWPPPMWGRWPPTPNYRPGLPAVQLRTNGSGDRSARRQLDGE